MNTIWDIKEEGQLLYSASTVVDENENRFLHQRGFYMAYNGFPYRDEQEMQNCIFLVSR